MISVVIPLYNASEYILDALDSVLLQNVECETIVVDDASSDGSDEAVRRYIKAHRDCNIRLVKNNQNLGAAKSRNIGVRMAKGEYIAFLDADDKWREGKLLRQLKTIEERNVPLVCTERELMRPDGTPTGRVIASVEMIDICALKKSNHVNCSSVLVKRDIMLENPMEHSEAHEDYLAWLKICERYGAFYCIREPFVLYRLSKGGKSRNKWRSAAMTYRTYVLAGYGRIKAAFMMLPYAINGIKKY